MRYLRGWRPMLRLARRDVLRSRARSILVLVMIALPVLAVTAADVVISTATVSGSEALERRLGAADARVEVQPWSTQAAQLPDPDQGSSWSGSQGNEVSLATVERALGRPITAIERHEGSVRYTTPKGIGAAEGTELDLADPLAAGLFELTAGRLPGSADEVVVNGDLAARGLAVGDDLELASGLTRRIVGTVESSSARGYPIVVGPPGSLGMEASQGQHTWLLDAGPVTWSDVRRLNAIGALVLSRAVMQDPPPASALPAELQGQGGNDSATLAVLVLVVVMALLEVVLLAGPAFAVGARRQSRNLALMAASGGTPGQSRRVVLAGAIVLGSAAAVTGVVLGVLAAAAALPLVQRLSDARLGPFDVPWKHLVVIGAFGLLSAFLAAVVPARFASRQDVVAVLAGRRGHRAPGVRSPLLGLVLLGLGIGGAVYGAKRPSGGEFVIAAAAVVAVLGMILLVPVVVAVLARLSRGLPLPLRYAVRDASRHRTRTVPAVAAVAATVAGVVALGIGISSDELENRRTYQPLLPMGTGSVTDYALGGQGSGTPVWPRLTDAVRRQLPDNTLTELKGMASSAADYDSIYLDLSVRGRPEPLLMSYAGQYGSEVLVADGRLPDVELGIPDGAKAAAERMLAEGGAVVLTTRPVQRERVRVRVQRYTEGGGDVTARPVSLPALFVPVGDLTARVQAVLSPEAAGRLGVGSETVGLVVDGPVSESAEKDVSEALGAISPDAGFYVERGYQADQATLIVQVVLGILGAVLMLGGTLTATFLALSDARPDLATLSAVGSAPRTRRAVAAAYALVIGLVGAVLGAAVGFIPGIAVTYPLTGHRWNAPDGAGPSHYLDVPWLLIGSLVLALPLVTALIVGVFARSRLPLVSRLE